MNNVLTALANLLWMSVGATVAVGAMAVLSAGRSDDPPCPYGRLLGMPCWMNVNGDYYKYRVVAVSHKGAVNIRRWEDETAKAFWVSKEKVKAGWLRFGEDPYDDIEVGPCRNA